VIGHWLKLARSGKKNRGLTSCFLKLVTESYFAVAK